MENKRVAVVNVPILGKVEISFYILSKRDVGNHKAFIDLRFRINRFRSQVEQVTRLFHVDTDGVRITVASRSVPVVCAVIGKAITGSNNQLVFVTLDEDRVAVSQILQISIEICRFPRNLLLNL